MWCITLLEIPEPCCLTGREGEREDSRVEPEVAGLVERTCMYLDD